LAVCLSLIGLLDESLLQMRKARQFTKDKNPLLAICEEAIFGRPEEVLHLVKAASVSGEISKAVIRHDPNINLLLDDAMIEKVLFQFAP
jgi:hypothetical protein